MKINLKLLNILMICIIKAIVSKIDKIYANISIIIN